jgi:Cu/Ag efflux pump CusA
MGGILVSGVLTLLVLPVLYDLFTRRRKGAAANGPASLDPEPGPN